MRCLSSVKNTFRLLESAISTLYIIIQENSAAHQLIQILGQRVGVCCSFHTRNVPLHVQELQTNYALDVMLLSKVIK